jgi:hypothetical protein
LEVGDGRLEVGDGRLEVGGWRKENDFLPPASSLLPSPSYHHPAALSVTTKAFPCCCTMLAGNDGSIGP